MTKREIAELRQALADIGCKNLARWDDEGLSELYGGMVLAKEVCEGRPAANGDVGQTDEE